MRSIVALYNFQAQLQDIHVKHFLNWRFGQLIVNFQTWLKKEKSIEDIFYIEDIDLIKLLDEFTEKYGEKVP